MKKKIEMKDDMEKIYKALLTKTMTARFGAELKKGREHKFSTYAGACSDSHRSSLKFDKKRKMIADGEEKSNEAIKKKKIEKNA